MKVRLGEEVLSRQVMPTRSYLSQSELPVTIGLGTRDKFDSLEIVWPGGRRQTVDPAQIHLDALNSIEEATDSP